MKTYNTSNVEDVLAAAENVIENWESGDLAGAVNNLQDAAHCCREGAAEGESKPKEDPKPSTPKVLIVVSGGVVQDVSASQDMDIYVIDHDNLQSGQDRDEARAPGKPHSICDVEQAVENEIAEYLDGSARIDEP